MSTDLGMRASGVLRVWLGTLGLLAIVAGIVILAWPAKSAAIVTGLGAIIFALYALIAGVVYIATGVFSNSLGKWTRIWRIVLGALSVVAGIIAMFNLAAMAIILVVSITILIGLTWITDGVLGLINVRHSSSKVVAVAFGIISIIAGATILFSPLYGAEILWWVFGIAAVVYGLMQLAAVSAFTRQ